MLQYVFLKSRKTKMDYFLLVWQLYLIKTLDELGKMLNTGFFLSWSLHDGDLHWTSL